MELLFWAIVFVILVIVEALSVQLISLWFAVGALITMICTYFLDLTFFGQLMIFIISSAVLLAITFPLIRKKLKGKIVSTNADLDIGETATVIEEINKNAGTGRVTLNGVDWSAFNVNPAEVIPKGSIVTVKEAQGAKLMVALKEEKVFSSNQ